MAAPEPIAWLHDRTPVVLASEDWDWWLNRETTADQSFVDDAVARSRPVASALLVHEVAPLTGNGPHLLDPV
jgi:putative SOS response-associated peptidase YedK